MNKIVIESCVDNLEDSIKSIVKGANRIEYCTSLSQDGLTPSINEVLTLLQKTDIPVRVMIRPSNTFYINNNEM